MDQYTSAIQVRLNSVIHHQQRWKKYSNPLTRVKVPVQQCKDTSFIHSSPTEEKVQKKYHKMSLKLQ